MSHLSLFMMRKIVLESGLLTSTFPSWGMYVEVCGSENAKSYEYREQIYKKNEVYVIFVQVYKEEKKWKNYLVKRILEIEEVRHSGIVKMFHSLKF